MKIMISTEILAKAFILQALLFSCMEPLDSIGVGSIHDYKDPEKIRITIQGKVKADHFYLFTNAYDATDLTESFIYGSGMLNKENTLRVSCELRHFARRDEMGRIHIKEGKFEYIVNNSDDFFGTYSGYTSEITGQSSLNLTLNISGGSGRYERGSGTINIIVKLDNEKDPSNLSLELTGAILIPERQNIQPYSAASN